MQNPYTLALRKFQQLGFSLDVTREALALGNRETTTGWRAMTYAETTIQMILLVQEAAEDFLMSGFYAKYPFTGYTATAVAEGDFVKDSNSVWYRVESVAPQGPNVASPWFYLCKLNRVGMYQAAPGALTWTLTRPNDPRNRAKVYIDTYARVAQITKDNDSTQATWAAIFSEPPYPLKSEFRAGSNPVQGLFVVEMPRSTARLDHDQVPYEYTEHTPIHICTVDSTGCTGTALAWKMEAEMRYVCETYPTALGNQRSFELSRKLDRDLGGMMLYDREYMMEYERDTT